MSFRLLPRLSLWRCVGGGRRLGRVFQIKRISHSTSGGDAESGKTVRRGLSLHILACMCTKTTVPGGIKYSLSQAFLREEGRPLYAVAGATFTTVPCMIYADLQGLVGPSMPFEP